MPPRTSYRLTEAGLELKDVIQAIDCWATRRITGRLGNAQAAATHAAAAHRDAAAH
jgi:DNA-binding HxlR family transcriptional regulator